MPTGLGRIVTALSSIASDNAHPLSPTATRLLFMLTGNFSAGRHADRSFLESPEVAELLQVVIGVRAPKATPDALRKWIVDVIEVMTKPHPRSEHVVRLN